MTTTTARLAPAAAAAPRLRQPLIWRLQALLSAYLPLLMMALLAAGTWWLVKHTPMPDGPMEPVPAKHEPDYQMKGFEMQRFAPTGELRVHLQGAAMRHYPDTDTIELDGVRLQAYGENGSRTEAQARRALSNSDGSEIQLLGEVQVQRYPANSAAKSAAGALPDLQVQGEFLHAFVNTEKLRSHLPVRIATRGGEMRAQNFEYDNLKGLLSFNGPSTARFDPPGLRGKAAKP